MQLFFAEDIQSNYYTLDGEESKHCIRVLRMTEGDELWLTDGQGTLCRCHIIDASPKACGLEVVECTVKEPRPWRLHLAVAPTKNIARMEWLIEKAVEMGIETITPVVCEHSERCVLRQDRMERIVTSAMKQSLKVFRPIVHKATALSALLEQPFEGQRLIAYCDGNHRTRLQEAYTAGGDVQILIGPEGDFSHDEVSAALASGYTAVTLGASRLRTETAAMAAVAYFNLVNG